MSISRFHASFVLGALAIACGGSSGSGSPGIDAGVGGAASGGVGNSGGSATGGTGATGSGATGSGATGSGATGSGATGGSGASGGAAGSGTGGAAGSGTGGTGGGNPIICANDAQCDAALGGDPCKSNLHCDTATATCKYDPLDSDKDGHTPVVCGGDDCNDANASIHPGAQEVCNGADDNCNGSVDEGLNCPTCTPGALLVLLDQSGSMSTTLTTGTRWVEMAGAVNAFVNESESNVLSIGLQYFPAANGDYCSATSYTAPAFAIAALPGASSSIASSISGHGPVGTSILTPVISGSVSYMQAWVTQNTGKPAGIVLITDGIPNDCSPSDTVAAAGQAAGVGWANSPQIPTWVISLGTDPNTTDWDSIAAAGGTTQAFNTGSNGQAAMQAALDSIRTALTGCP